MAIRTTAQLAALAAALIAAPLLAQTERINITVDDRIVDVEYRGNTEINVVPPFEEALVQITVDGQEVFRSQRPPYRVVVDFGSQPIEHHIAVRMRSRDGKKAADWTRVINEGLKALSVSLQPLRGGFEAVTTAPKGDPIAVVEFYDGNRLLARTTERPYRVMIPDGVTNIIQVTARTRSGIETTDFFTASGDVLAQSYDVRTVPLYVSVVDDRGKTRTDLGASDFRIYDAGAEAKILEFGQAFNDPISIALVIDSSASMQYELPGVVKAAERFIDSVLKPNDRAAVFSVHTSPKREVELTDDIARVKKGLSSMEALGKTSLFDALAASIRELQGQTNRRAIVILTDGNDTSSYFSFEEVHRQAQLACIPVYVIAFGHPEDFARDLDRMHLLATETGGFLSVSSRDDLSDRYAAIEKDLRAKFAIKYQVASESKPNEWRPVRVVVSSPRLEARTIRGYFAN